MTMRWNEAELATLPVSHIAAMLPGAAGVFLEHDIEFCCGGDQPLADVVATHGLDLSAMIGELTEAPETVQPTWYDAETPALIEHIKARYHTVHLRELPWLLRLARKVEARHKDHPEVPAGLTELLARMEAEIKVHQQREEVVLFPMMLRGSGPSIASAIATMRAEHDDHGAALAAIDRLTHERKAPADACATWKALCIGLTRFHDDLMMHVHLENNILFPRFAGNPAGHEPNL